MELIVNVKRKGFEKDGKRVEFYEFSTNFGGEEVKIKLDKDKNELFKYFLGKMDIPLEKEDEKETLTKKLLSGEITAEEKAKLRGLLLEEGE